MNGLDFSTAQFQGTNFSIGFGNTEPAAGGGAFSADAANAFKLEHMQGSLTRFSINAGGSAAQLQQFDQFLNEAQTKLDSLLGKLGSGSAAPVNSGSGSASSVNSGSNVSAEPTWSVDRSSNTINLDNGYRLKLNEQNSEMLLEKLGEDGGVEKATKVWGDPHIDAGNDGTTDADFWKDTTMVLEDGTKITIGTEGMEGTDMTFADRLTITKGDQAVEVSGLMQGADALEIGDVNSNGKELDAQTNDGWIMSEGQGNDWILDDRRTLGQDKDYFEFAKTEKTQEMSAEDALAGGVGPTGQDPGSAGADGPSGVDGGTAPVGGVGGAGGLEGLQSALSALSDALRTFLEQLGMNSFAEQGEMDAQGWGDLHNNLSGRRDAAAGNAQVELQMLNFISSSIRSTLEEMGQAGEEE